MGGEFGYKRQVCNASMGRLPLIIVCLVQAFLPGIGWAQQPRAAAPVTISWAGTESAGRDAKLPGNAFSAEGAATSAPTLVNIVPLPRMAPELALEVFEARLVRQPLQLAGYSATQVIDANLPDTHQEGKWELQRRYSAPKTLEFKPLKFIGDSFVKTNVIARLLKSEADHVQNDDPTSTALSAENYKFKYKGIEELDGRLVHVFELKPRQKRPGLVKGKMYLDVHTGALRRVAGELAKSPSFFVKKLEFVQDYAEIAGFTFPVHTVSTAKTRIVGRATVEMTIRDYAPMPAPQSAGEPAVQPVSYSPAGSN